MELQNDKVVMDFEEFILISLFTGIACQAFAKVNNMDKDTLIQLFHDEAEKQYKQMTHSMREQMVDAYVQLNKG